MSVRIIGADPTMTAVPVNSGATITRNQFVTLSSGEAVAIGASPTANLAISMENFPDAEYEGTRTQIDVALLGEDQEIEVPFTTATTIAKADIGAGPFALTAAGVVDIDVTASGVFTIRRLGRETEFGAASGYVVGVVSDAAAF